MAQLQALLCLGNAERFNCDLHACFWTYISRVHLGHKKKEKEEQIPAVGGDAWGARAGGEGVAEGGEDEEVLVEVVGA